MTEEKLKKKNLIFGIGFRFIYKNPDTLERQAEQFGPRCTLLSCVQQKQHMGGRIACFNGLR
jgi:hypothetical protein